MRTIKRGMLPPLLVLALAACDSSGAGNTKDVVDDTAAEAVSDASPGPACEEVAEFVQIAACMVRSDEEPGESQGPVDYSAEGTVIEVGDGMPPDNCFHQCLHIGGCLDEQLMSLDTQWARFEEADGTIWTTAFIAPFDQPWLTPGDKVSVAYSYVMEVFAPDMGVLEVRKDGDLVVWLGVAGAPESLEAPEGISLKKGEAVCQDSEDCGSWAWYLLDVSLGEESGTAGYRTDPLSIAGYKVLNGGVEAGTSEEVRCPDWFVADTRVAIWPGR